jgi:hypothetical protein
VAEMSLIAEFTPVQTVVYSILAFVVIVTALIVSLMAHQ